MCATGAYESDPSELTAGQGPSANVLIVDNSFSMSYQLGGRTLLDAAKKRAGSFLDDLPREATAALVLGVPPAIKTGAGGETSTNAVPIAAERAELSFNHDEVRGALTRVEVVRARADLEAAIRRADALCALSALLQKRIVVLTDLARHSWPTRSGTGAPIPIASGAQLVIHDVSGGHALPNSAVVSVEVVPAADLGPGGHRVTARIASFSDKAEEGVPVELRVAGRIVTRGFVDLPAGGTSEKVFHAGQLERAAPPPFVDHCRSRLAGGAPSGVRPGPGRSCDPSSGQSPKFTEHEADGLRTATDRHGPRSLAPAMGAFSAATRVYARREPEKDVLYRVVQAHVETFLQGTESADHAGLPTHVRRELYGYLNCGILARGAARVACMAYFPRTLLGTPRFCRASRLRCRRTLTMATMICPAR